MSRLIAKADVTYALQFTPYDATNPLGFQSAAQIAGILGAYPTTTVMNAAIAASRATVPLIPLLATVAQSGLYSDLSGKPLLVTQTDLSGKLDKIGDASNATVVTGPGRMARPFISRFTDEYRVADSGADSTGTADAQPLIQAHINEAASRGARRYLLDDGRYLIDGADLTVPTGVTLQGPWSGVGDDSGSAGIVGRYSTYPGSLIINPARTVRPMRMSGMAGVVFRKKGLLAGSDMASIVSNTMNKTGNAISLVSSGDENDDVHLKDLLILGFGRAVLSDGSCRLSLRRIKFDCTHGIAIYHNYDWSQVVDCEGWPFLVGHSSFFTSALRSVSSTSVVGGKRRVVTSTPHGYQTGWPVVVGGNMGVPAARGIWSITVIDPSTFDLEVGLTGALMGRPQGVGAAATTGGTITAAIMVNGGVAYQCLAYDWGQFTNSKSYGFAIGFDVQESGNALLMGCGSDNYYACGGWGTSGFRIMGTSGNASLIGCQSAAQSTAYEINTAGSGFDDIHQMTSCTSWGIEENHIDVQSGGVAVNGGHFDNATSLGAMFRLRAAGTALWMANTSGVTNLQMEGDPSRFRSSGGNSVIESKTVQPAFAALGTTQATASPANAEILYVAGSSGANAGVLLPSVGYCLELTIINGTGANILIYPPSNGSINAGGLNIPAIVVPQTSMRFIQITPPNPSSSASAWVTIGPI